MRKHNANFSLIRNCDLSLLRLTAALFVAGCSSSAGHAQAHAPGVMQRVQSAVGHWLASKEKTSSSHVSHVRPSPSPQSAATALAPHEVATAPVHVEAQLRVPLPVPQRSEAPSPARSSAIPPASASPTTTAPPTVSPVPVLAPEEKPAIVDISISATDLHAGDLVSGIVVTTSNVASVEARIKTYSTALNRMGVGRFALSMRVPALPFFLRRTYQLQVIARNAAGAVAEEDFPISVH